MERDLHRAIRFPSAYVAELHHPILYYSDADGDGYGDPTVLISDCSAPAGYVANNTDCDDANPTVHPEALEACNGIDDNCDARVDEVAQAPGLVGWWRGEGNTGDATGNNNGTWVNGPTYQPGNVGQAFHVSPPNTYVEIPDSPLLDFTTSLTVESWVYPFDLISPSSQPIASKWGAGNWAYMLEFRPLGEMLRSSISGDGTTNDSLEAPNVIAPDTWTHVATTFDAGLWKLYVNGNLVASKNSTVTSLFVGTANLRIGKGVEGAVQFEGLIDELAVYNQTLSASTIQAIYNAGSGGRCALVAVDNPQPTTRAFQFAAPWPNPSARWANIRFNLPIGAHVRVDVFDIAGRRVLSLINGQYLTAGEHRVAWDGRDASGRRVSPGIYEVRVATGATVGVRSIVMIE